MTASTENCGDMYEGSDRRLHRPNEGLVASVAIHIFRHFCLGHCLKFAGRVKFQDLAEF